MILKENEVILFQGDSITDGNRGRSEDLNHIMGHGYQYIVSAKLHGDNIGRNLVTVNRGISGNRISDLYGRWREDTLLLKPTVLSILVGINDIIRLYRNESGSDSERYEKIFRLMLDECLAENKDIKFIILEPFAGEKFADETCGEFVLKHIGKYQEKARKIANDYNAVFVPLQDMFLDVFKMVPSETLIWDGVHPTIIGHELMARQWLKAARENLYK